MHNHCINKLLDLEDVIVKKVVHADTFVKIFIETKPKEHVCPCCGLKTKKIHDYRLQTIKDLPFQMKHCYLVLHKRRYRCSCGKRFFENYRFLPRYFQRTSRLTAFIASALHATVSIKDISRQVNVSTATVGRILDSISYGRAKLGEAVSIDEFKGNAASENINAFLLILPSTGYLIFSLTESVPA